MSVDALPFVGAPTRELSGMCGLCRTAHTRSLDVEAGLRALDRGFAWLEHEHVTVGERLRACGGKMVAALAAVSPRGERLELFAFSGDLFGIADVDGFVPSVIRRELFAAEERETLAALAHIEERRRVAKNDAERLRLLHERRRRSRSLMSTIHDTVRLANRAGRVAPLRDIFAGGGMPSGTGDCALPKLLHAANAAGLEVRGVAEAWFGPSVGGRAHRSLAEPCAARCVPLLGYLVCDVP